MKHSSAPAPSGFSAASPPRPRSRRLWRLFIFMTAALAVGLAFTAGVKLGLWYLRSPPAKQWVLNRLETCLGVRIEAQQIHINWHGRTTLTGVRMWLPLGQRPFLRVARLQFTHSSVPWFLLTRDVNLRSIRIVDPRLNVRQNADGAWDLTQAWGTLRQAWRQWRAIHAQTPPLSAIPLPSVTLTGGAVAILTPAGQRLQLTNIAMRAHPGGPLMWHFHLWTHHGARPGRFNAVGLLVPGQQWLHHVRLQASLAASWLKLLWPRWPGGAITVRTGLRGHVAADTLTETLSHLHVVDVRQRWSLSGGAHGYYGPQRWRLAPNQLQLRWSALPLAVNFYRGHFWATTQGIHLQNLAAQVGGGDCHLSGLLQPSLGSGQLQFFWHNVSLLGGRLQSGSFNGSLTSPWPGRRVFSATLTSRGQNRYGRWNVQLKGGATGSLARGFHWQVDAPRLSLWPWTRTTPVQLTALHLSGAYAHDKITIHRCTLPGAPHSLLSGSYTLPLGLWRVRLHGPGNIFPLLALPANVQIHLQAYGNFGGMQLQQLIVKNPSWDFTAAGNCLFAGPYPVHLLLTVTGLPLASPTAAPATGWAVGGLVSGHLMTTGTLLPLNLSLKGRLMGAHLLANGHPLALPPVRVQGTLLHHHIQVQAIPVALLGGQVTVTATARTSGRLASMDFAARNLSAASLAAWLLPPPYQKAGGRLNLQLHLAMPQAAWQTAQLTGALTLRHGTLPPLPGGLLLAPGVSATARINLAHGVLSLAPISIRGGGGDLSGQVTWNPALPRQAQLRFTLAHWPLRLRRPRLSMLVSGQGQGRLDWTKPLAAWGAADAQASLFQARRLIASIHTHISSNASVVTFSRLRASVAGNRCRGAVTYNTAHILASSAHLHYALPHPAALYAVIRNLLRPGPAAPARRSRLSPSAPEAPGLGFKKAPGFSPVNGGGRGPRKLTGSHAVLPPPPSAASDAAVALMLGYPPSPSAPAGAIPPPTRPTPPLAASRPTPASPPAPRVLRMLHSGKMTGSLLLRAAPGPHPLAPLELRLNVHAPAARFGAMRLGDSRFDLFINHHSLVLDHSRLALAGGILRLWAQLGRHSGGVYSTHVVLRFNHIHLGQITRTVQPNAPPIPGVLRGHLSVVVLPGHWNDAFGEGDLHITHSNLTHSTIIASLYRGLHLGLDQGAPTGRGSARWRVENGDAYITELRYWNHGVNVLASGSLRDIWRIPDSRIRGYAIATAQPFRILHIPFVPQAHGVLTALESNVSAVQVGGTWANPISTPATFTQLGTAIQQTFVRAILGRPQASSPR